MPPENEQVVSLMEKRSPITLTADPAKPMGGLSVIAAEVEAVLNVSLVVVE